MNATSLVTAALRMLPWKIRSSIKRLPVIRSLQRLIVSNALNGRTFEHRVDAGPARGIVFRVRMPEDKGIWTGTYEQKLAERVAECVKSGAIAYDIGAWHGFFAGVMAAQGAGAVHVFEPLPENVQRIQELIALNPALPIVLHACALGDADADMDLLVMPETSMAKLEVSQFQREKTGTSRVRIPVRNIDGIVARGEARPPAVIKLDVEGAEYMVLKGALSTIGKHRPVIIAEIHSAGLLEQCSGLLRELGYSVTSLDENTATACERDVYQICAFPKV